MTAVAKETRSDEVMVAVVYDPELMEFDLATIAGRIARDGSWDTVVALSLYTNKRDPKDLANTLGGWWGDSFEEFPGYEVGSLLWTLEGKRIDADLLRDAKRFAEDGLAWLVEVGAASLVSATSGTYERGVAITIEITEPGQAAPAYAAMWDLQGRKLSDAA